MMTRLELVELDRALRGTSVLSVYLNGSENNPAERTAWRRALARAIEDARASLDGSRRDELLAFESCVAHLGAELSRFTGFLPAPGWVAFVTTEGVRHARALPTAMPLLVAWQRGARIAPYVRAYEKPRPVHLAVVDARSARIYRQLDGELERVESMQADEHRAKPETMGQHPPRQGFHGGTRGGTAADLGDRELLVARERLMNHLADRLVARSGRDGWIVIGGTPSAVAAAEAALPSPLKGRVAIRSDVDVRATEAQLVVAAERGASELRVARESAIVDDMLARWSAAGKGVARTEPTLVAVRDGAVDHLCLTDRFLREHAEEAEAAVRGALDQGAEVEYVSGAAADRLDAAGGGVAARLRHVSWAPSVASGQSYATR